MKKIKTRKLNQTVDGYIHDEFICPRLQMPKQHLFVTFLRSNVSHIHMMAHMSNSPSLNSYSINWLETQFPHVDFSDLPIVSLGSGSPCS